jgi:hypothetical protein
MLLKREFPRVMKIRYKDSYANRREMFLEKVRRYYVDSRLRLSNLSKGRMRYAAYQINDYFGKGSRIDEYRNTFLGGNHLKQIMSSEKKEKIFRKTKEKHYFFNLFQRVLFLEQFYASHGFSEQERILG